MADDKSPKDLKRRIADILLPRKQLSVKPSTFKSKPEPKREEGLKGLKAIVEKDTGPSTENGDGYLENGYKNDRAGQAAGSADNPNTSINSKIALSLRYRVPKKLAKLDNDCLKKLSNYILTQLYLNKSERDRFIQNLYLYRKSWMDFERTGLQITVEGAHDQHVPIVFEKGKAMYARLVNAVLGVQPVFNVRPNKEVSEIQKQDKEDLLRWVTNEYANNGMGIEEAIDADCWNFILDGTSITKHDWFRDVRKFVDVEEKEIRPIQIDPSGNIMTEEKEVEREEVVYDGPMLRSIPLEDVYVIGANCEEIDDADLVIHRQYYTKSDLIKKSNQGFFIDEAVDRVLKSSQPSYARDTSDQEAYLAIQKDETSGIETHYKDAGRPVYTVHETYLRYDIDDDGIDEELVVWLEPESRTILRMTYLDRVSPSGKRPFVLKKLIKREGKPFGIGFAEMLYGLNNTIDYVTNQRLDAGMFNIFPWFVFRAGGSIQGQDVKIAAGKGIPVDDTSDISFPRVNGNTAFGYQEEAAQVKYAEDVTGINAFSTGQVGGQGAARTATGAAGLSSNLDANLDIYIKHYQWGFKKNLKFLDKQVQELLPLGLEYRVLGLESQSCYKRFADRQSIKFDCDFELTGNSVNSNKSIERDTAQMMLQILQNPLALQAGLVQPKNLYSAYKNLLQKYEVRDINAYLTKPEDVQDSPYTAKDEINMILAGVQPPVVSNDKHAEKLAYYDEFEKSPEFAYYTDAHLPLYQAAKKAHQQYADAISAQASLAGAQGQSVAPQLAAQLAAGGGVPQKGVPQQLQDLGPQNPAQGGPQGTQ